MVVWIKIVVKNKNVHDFLAQNEAKCQFNLTKASWFGGQFEKLIGLAKTEKCR